MAQVRLFATVLGGPLDGSSNKTTRVDVYKTDGSLLWSVTFVDQNQTLAKDWKPVAISTNNVVYATNGGSTISRVESTGVAWTTPDGDAWGGAPADMVLDEPNGWLYTFSRDGAQLQRHTISDGAHQTPIGWPLGWDESGAFEGQKVDIDADGKLYAHYVSVAGSRDKLRCINQSAGADWTFQNPNTDATIQLLGAEPTDRVVYFNDHEPSTGSAYLRKYNQDGTEVTAGNWPILHPDAQVIEGAVAHGDCLFAHETAIHNELRAYEFDGTLRWSVPSPIAAPIVTSYEAGGGVGVVHVRDDATGEVVSHKFNLTDGSEITTDSWPITFSYADGDATNRPTHWSTADATVVEPVESSLEVELDTTRHVLSVQLSIDWPLEHVLPVALSTSRIGNGDAGDILAVSFTTVAGAGDELPVLLDVAAPDGVLGSAPTTGPVVTGSIQERVGGGITASLQREDGTHPTGGSASLQHTQAVGDGTYRTHAVNKAVASAPYGKGWSRQGGVPVATLDTPNPGDALNETLLPELVKVPVLSGSGITYEVPASSGSQPYLTSLDAPLGSRIAGSDDDCAARLPLDASGRQTRVELAQAAVEQAGMTLIILGNIPNSDRPVEMDYTTEGQTAASVLSDMLLASNPRVWYRPGAVYVDGRIFAGGAGSTDPTAFIAADDLADDGASWSDQAGSSEPEPLLADYTDRCEQRNPDATTDPDAEEGVDVPGTFETFENGTYSWQERSGQRVGPFGDAADSTFRVTNHTLTKSGGQLVRELTIVKEQVAPDYRAGGVNQILTTSRTEVENEYHGVCPEALTSRFEQTMQRKRVEDIPNVSNTLEADEDAAFTPDENHEMIYDAMPRWYMEEESFVEQRWHAEGWLRARHATSRQMDGMIAFPQFDSQETLTGYEVSLTYRTDERSETYVPVGGGLWHISTTVKTTQERPVREPVNPDAVEGDEDYGVLEIVDVQTVAVQNHYTVVTDQAPPSVSCGGSTVDESTDPCSESSGDPYQDCIDDATERWEIDHADWEARQAHNSPKRVWSIQANRLLPGKRVGQVAGGGLITGVTHTLDSIGGSTTLEVSEWLA